MERATERIDLGGGQWWELWTTVTRRMRKAFNKAAMASLAGGLKNQNGNLDLRDAEAVRRAALSHVEALDLNLIDDAYLLHGTRAYSFGDTVSLDVIDALPDSVVKRVLERMRELYAEPSEEAQKKATGTS